MAFAWYRVGPSTASVGPGMVPVCQGTVTYVQQLTELVQFRSRIGPVRVQSCLRYGAQLAHASASSCPTLVHSRCRVCIGMVACGWSRPAVIHLWFSQAQDSDSDPSWPPSPPLVQQTEKRKPRIFCRCGRWSAKKGKKSLLNFAVTMPEIIDLKKGWEFIQK